MKIISTIKEFFETTINTTEMLKRQRLKNKMLIKTEYLEPYSLPKRPFTIKNILIKCLTHLVLHYDD